MRWHPDAPRRAASRAARANTAGRAPGVSGANFLISGRTHSARRLRPCPRESKHQRSGRESDRPPAAWHWALSSAPVSTRWLGGAGRDRSQKISSSKSTSTRSPHPLPCRAITQHASAARYAHIQQAVPPAQPTMLHAVHYTCSPRPHCFVGQIFWSSKRWSQGIGDPWLTNKATKLAFPAQNCIGCL